MNSSPDALTALSAKPGGMHRRVPGATYRFQFEPAFTLTAATPLVRYLHDLGITDCYASPLSQPSPSSRHGYDVCDYNQLNPELGDEKDLDAFCTALGLHNMGLLADFVPNHMGINHPFNLWWQDVLQQGSHSRFASFFDINWTPPDPKLRNKVLLPVLGETCDEAVLKGLIRLVFEEGRFWIAYYDSRFPLAPSSWYRLLRSVMDRLNPDAPPSAAVRQQLLKQTQEWEKGDPDDLYIILREWHASRSTFRQLISKTLSNLNGAPGRPQTLTRLQSLLDEQYYRLAFWRTGNRDLNYRRFFDITSLAGVRVEDREVFAAVHQQLFQWVAQGRVTGLRIDHPDGLWNPAAYFANLQTAFLTQYGKNDPGARTRLFEAMDKRDAKRGTEQPVSPAPRPAPPLYVVAEKILSADEPLPENWEIDGTTGYDFLNDLNDLFVDGSNRESLDRIYRDFTGNQTSFLTETAQCKRIVLREALISETQSLCRALQELAVRRADGQDFDFEELSNALCEIMVALRVYRTYLTESSNQHSPEDHRRLEEAILEASQHNPDLTSAIRFVGDLLLLKSLDGGSDRAGQVRFVMRFQQLTGPVMAKGLEDTAFYRFNRLLSVNEVGGHPDRFGLAVEMFHQLNHQRLQRWPHSLLATATHDTKRGEDIRARLNVLSEMPAAWQAAAQTWSRLNADKKPIIAERPAPLAQDEYFLYQTLVGAWPLDDPGDRKEFTERICACLRKSLREAKQQTSWIQPNEAYESALDQFITQLIDPEASPAFHQSFLPFQRTIAYLGHFNSLAQTLIKATAPGVPDFYQGTEFWELSLVDPDNRRPVNFQHRREVLEWLKSNADPSGIVNKETLNELVSRWQTGWIKLYLIWRTLNFRSQHPALFSEGDYRPVSVQGTKASHICAFARVKNNRTVVVAVPRLVASLVGHREAPAWDAAVWEDTQLALEPNSDPWRNLLTGETLTPVMGEASAGLPVRELFKAFPVALLVQEPSP